MNPSSLPPCSIRIERESLWGTKIEDRDFLDIARNWASQPYSGTLLSGGELDCSRYSIAAREPFLIFKSKGDRSIIQTPHHSFPMHGNPLDCLDELLELFHPEFPLIIPPFAGGAIGYFAYDLKNEIEHLPQTAQDDLTLPDIFLFWPRQVLVHDRHQQSLCSLTFALGANCIDRLLLNGGRWGDREMGKGLPQHPFSPSPKKMILDDYHEVLKRESRRTSRIGPLKSNFTHQAYLDAVRRVRHYIREGDVYQVNLSQRFQFDFEGDPFHLWESLFAVNPAPFYAYIHAGDHHQVLSTSMERFLYRRDSYIETRPIKGTRRRGKTPEEDAELKADLFHSPKDDAELSMIVDLLRNDLGRVCLPRSVRVAEHKRVEGYQNVYHLISIVTGQLQSKTSHVDLLRATFPGGSITGCPKIRAMEIIDELEPHVRHVYTGAIGYLGWHRNLDLNVAIRTALMHRQKCIFSVGGGIVYDSDEEDEYQETLHKGQTLFQVIEKLGKEIL
jgi:para-aminobenzoate synthetase component 1